MLRSFVHIGANSQLAQNLTVELDARIGAGVRTINNKELIWRDPDREQPLLPPRFDTGAKVVSGATVLAGVTIGERSLVGAARS
jgi:acetyltransferase-like isoleucine patch superfamily enzyme